MNTLFSYTAHGLHIHSDIPLGELVGTDGMRGDADVTVRRGAIGNLDLQGPPGSDRLCVTAESIHYAWAGLGSILVRSGCEIIVDSVRGSTDRAIRWMVIGPGLGAVLQQRGLVVLHASAAVIDGVGVLFVGESGGGKSTTLAALHTRGHGILTDDVAGVEMRTGSPLVWPSYPQLKLRVEAAAALWDRVPGVAPSELLGELRWIRRPEDAYIQSPVPLSRVFILADGDRSSLERVTGYEAVLELIRHSYMRRVIGAVTPAPAHLDRCARLAEQVPIFRLKRPRVMESLTTVVHMVEGEISGSGSWT